MKIPAITKQINQSRPKAALPPNANTNFSGKPKSIPDPVADLFNHLKEFLADSQTFKKVIKGGDFPLSVPLKDHPTYRHLYYFVHECGICISSKVKSSSALSKALAKNDPILSLDFLAMHKSPRTTTQTFEHYKRFTMSELLEKLNKEEGRNALVRAFNRFLERADDTFMKS